MQNNNKKKNNKPTNKLANRIWMCKLQLILAENILMNDFFFLFWMIISMRFKENERKKNVYGSELSVLA